MKLFHHILVLLLTVSFSITSQAQESSGVRLSGFGGPMVQVTSLDGDFSPQIGGGAALLVNEKFYIGGYGLVLMSPLERTLNRDNGSELDLTINFNQFGLWLGYIINPDNAVQVTANSYVGFGTLNPQELEQNDRIYLIGPHVGVQYAAADWLRIELNAGYRFMGNVNESAAITSIFNNQDLSGFFSGLTFRFGGFK